MIRGFEYVECLPQLTLCSFKIALPAVALSQEAPYPGGGRGRRALELDRLFRAPSSPFEILQIEVELAEIDPGPAESAMNLDRALEKPGSLLTPPAMVVWRRLSLGGCVQNPDLFR